MSEQPADRSQRLARLVRLHQEGELTDDEFLAASASLTPNAPAPPPAPTAASDASEASGGLGPSVAADPEEAQREVLRRYTDHVQAECVDCGYRGLCGVHNNTPWYAETRVVTAAAIGLVLMLFASGVTAELGILGGLVFGGFLGTVAVLVNRRMTQQRSVCPRCTVAEEQTGAVPGADGSGPPAAATPDER